MGRIHLVKGNLNKFSYILKKYFFSKKDIAFFKSRYTINYDIVWFIIFLNLNLGVDLVLPRIGQQLVDVLQSKPVGQTVKTFERYTKITILVS